MPEPLQLVAYLPLVETVDWERTQKNLLDSLGVTVPENILMSKDKGKNRALEESSFWQLLAKLKGTLDVDVLGELWKKFPDSSQLVDRANAHHNNSNMQPNSLYGSLGLLAAPAFYDWIDVSLTLTENEKLPTIAVYPWKSSED